MIIKRIRKRIPVLIPCTFSKVGKTNIWIHGINSGINVPYLFSKKNERGGPTKYVTDIH